MDPQVDKIIVNDSYQDTTLVLLREINANLERIATTLEDEGDQSWYQKLLGLS